MEESPWEKGNKERKKRKEQEEALKKQGWQSSADLAYRLAHKYQRSGANLAEHMAKLIERVLAEQPADYRAQHLVELGIKRMKLIVSPDLAAKIEEVIEKKSRP